MHHPVTRRETLRAFSVGGLALSLPRLASARSTARRPPVRTVTRGPRYHWFGYYDKLEFDPTDRYLLANEVDFEHRSPSPQDKIRVGMVDTQSGDEWIELGSSQAWCWQQGCMLQWLPGSDSEVLWNDLEGDRYVCRVLDTAEKAMRTLPMPIYALSPDGRFAVTTDFSRIQSLRRGYGYVGLPDGTIHDRSPKDSGIWRLDMESGEANLIFSLADAAAIPFEGQPLFDRWNYFNHLLVSPCATRMAVLHRWRGNAGVGKRARPKGRFTTRLFTLSVDGSDRFVLDASGNTSHFIWRDPEHICAWSKPHGLGAGLYLFRDQSKHAELVGEGVITENGHNTYLPRTDNEWILSDTYPDPLTREQSPYLFHVPSNRKVPLGAFHSPPHYRGEWRCDTHPRSSNSGRLIAIDSPHTGEGRQVHLIDVSEVIDCYVR